MPQRAAFKPFFSTARLGLIMIGFILALGVRPVPAQPLTPPARPDVTPLIGKVYRNDSNRNRVDDRLESKAVMAVAMSQLAVTPQGRQEAQATLAGMTEVELIFTAPITQRQIDQFLALGGQITYIYKAVSYGWNGRIPLGQIDRLPSLMGATLVLVDEMRPAMLHLRLATQTGRVRPVWADGFAGSSGYDGTSDISIAIIDTGLDDGHTDLSGRQAYWHDYTSDGESTPRDIVQHGTHVAGIALGTGASLGTGTTLYYTDSGDLTGVPNGSFYPSIIDFPQVSTSWSSTATWLGGGTGDLLHAYTAKGASSYSSQNSTSGSSGVTLDTSFTPSSSNAYTAALLSNASMSTYAVASSMTNFSTVGDGFNTLRGVAPGCRWVGAKVFTNSGSGSGLDINSAVDDMVVKRETYDIKVLNMSIGIIGEPGISVSLRQKINTAANNGIIPVISAGNDGTEAPPPGAREIDDPGRAAMALTVGASNDINELTDYTSHGFSSLDSTSGQEEDYKPDVLAPGGSDYYSLIMSVDTNDADGEDISFSDVQANDYYNIKGTSMASPFAAGCAALVIDALQSTNGLTGASWDFTSSADVRLVKMLLCATATETNVNREAAYGYNPTLERASAGPNGYPAGKDEYEGYGMLNVDAAIEGGTVAYTAGDTVNETLGGSDTARRAWARKVRLISGIAFDPALSVPAGADFDMYLYSFTPSAYGTATILDSSTNTSTGADESINYTPGSSADALLVVKCVSGSGTFSLTSTAVIGITVTPDVWVIGPQPLDYVGESGTFTVENGGNVPENFTIMGGHGSSGWTLESTVDTDAFKVEVDKGDDGSYETVLTTSEQPFATDVPVSGAETFGLKYSAPTGDTVGGGADQTFTVTVTASAASP